LAEKIGHEIAQFIGVEEMEIVDDVAVILVLQRRLPSRMQMEGAMHLDQQLGEIRRENVSGQELHAGLPPAIERVELSESLERRFPPFPTSKCAGEKRTHR
jgi:hypothetical protein